ncbi:MAG: hypothetical protein CVV21_08705 [Candidatus Goldiibacteriota bacterium HGW-Goldbacteria-1]|jgi:uncharacterized protein YceK|nr:MAG: hypothetical protein CVV21_08705 [Candidatus Goldiibacteriota bacterium HGW-Goldbacteria-1]
MKKCVILLLIPILVLSGCATVSPVSTNENHDFKEKGFEHSDKQQEYVEDRDGDKTMWLALSGVGAGLFAVGSLVFVLAGLSRTQKQYDEATSKAIPLMIGGAALGVVSLTLFFTM